MHSKIPNTLFFPTVFALALMCSPSSAQEELVPAEWLCIHRGELDADFCESKIGSDSIFVTTGETTEQALRTDMVVGGTERPLVLHRRWATARALIDMKDEVFVDDIKLPIGGFGSGWYHDYENVLIQDFDTDTVAYVPGNSGRTETFDISTFDVDEDAPQMFPGETYPIIKLWIDWQPIEDHPLGGVLESVLVQETDGRRLVFELEPNAEFGLFDDHFYLRRIIYPSGYEVAIDYYGWPGIASVCRAGPEDEICLIDASDGAAIHFEFSGTTTDDEITRVRGGFWDGTTFSEVRTTDYTHETKTREIWNWPDGDMLIRSESTDVLSTVTHRKGTDLAFEESYDYTSLAYLGSGSKIRVHFFTSKPGSPGNVLSTPWLLQALYHGAGAQREFSRGHEYHDDASGALDRTPGAMEEVTYADDPSDPTGNTELVTHKNLSTVGEPTCVYTVDKVEAHLLGVSGADCGHVGGTTLERDTAAGGNVEAKSLENNLRVTYDYDESFGRTTLVQVNAVGQDPKQEATSAFTAGGDPLFVLRRDYQVPTAMDEAFSSLTPTKEESKFSAVRDLPTGSTWPVVCGGLCQTPEHPSFHIGTYRDFDVGDYGNLNFNENPGGRITQTARAGWTATNIPLSGFINLEHELYRTELEYLPGSSEKLTRIRDPLGAEIQIQYGTDLRPSTVQWVPAVGPTTVLSSTTGYNTDGQPFSVVDERNVTTAFDYYDDGRVKKRTMTYGTFSRVWNFDYYADGTARSVFVGSDLLGLAVGFTTDRLVPSNVCGNNPPESCAAGLGWLQRVTDVNEGVRFGPNFNRHRTDKRTFGTEGLPRQIDVTNALGATVRRSGVTFDARYRLDSAVRHADGTTYATRLAYDSVGNVTEVTAPRFPSTANSNTTYTPLGVPKTATIGAAGTLPFTTELKYDAHNNVSEIRDTANGRTTLFLYDDFGRVIAENSPDMGTIHNVYNARDQITKRELADGTVVDFTYEGRHRLKTETHLGKTITYHYDKSLGGNKSASCLGVGTVAYEPDVNLLRGRLSAVQHLAGTTRYEYSPFGEIAGLYEEPIGSSSICDWRITKFSYDVGGRLTQMVYPSGRVITYLYASGSLYPTTVEVDEAPVLTSVTHTVEGALRGFVSTGVTLNKDRTRRNLAGEQLNKTYTGAGGDLFAWDVSDRDPHGNIETVSETASGQTIAYEYDTQDRLNKWGRDGLGTPTNARGLQECTLAYDAAGNRLTDECYNTGGIGYGYAVLSNTLETLDWSTNAQVCGVSTPASVSTQPDALGRLTRSYRGRFSSVPIRLTYGAFEYLDSVDTNGDTVPDFTYAYDHENLRREKIGGGVNTKFDYDPLGRLIAERIDSGASVSYREYVYLSGEPVLMLVDGGTYVLATDHLATPRRAYNIATGALAWAADYEAFGRAWVYGSGGTAPSVNVPLRFPGQYEDMETGLHYNWHRYYDPGTGRYVTPDPLGLGGTDATLFSYASGNPVTRIDPFGLLSGNGDAAERAFLNAMDTLPAKQRDALVGATAAVLAAAAAGAAVAVGGPAALRAAAALFTSLGPALGAGGPAALQRCVQRAPRASRLLSQFTRSSIDKIVSSSQIAKGATSRGASLLQKRVADGAVQGVKATQANAERIIHDVLNAPLRSQGTLKFGQIDIIGKSFGQNIGIRINFVTERIIGFRTPDF